MIAWPGQSDVGPVLSYVELAGDVTETDVPEGVLDALNDDLNTPGALAAPCGGR